MDKWFEPAPFMIRICLSTIVGCFSGWMCFQIWSATWQKPTLYGIYESLMDALMFVPLIFIIIIPLMILVLVLGAIFEKQIAKRPLLWTIGASFVIWVTALSFLFLTGSKNEWWMTHSNVERMTYVITSGESKLVLAGALGAGSTFYLLGLIRLGSKQPEQ